MKQLFHLLTVNTSNNLSLQILDIYFETDEHVNILVNDSDLEPRAIICTHDFKSGYADSSLTQKVTVVAKSKHIPPKFVKKCNHLVIMDLIGTTNYPKCPHK